MSKASVFSTAPDTGVFAVDMVVVRERGVADGVALAVESEYSLAKSSS